MNPFKLNDTYDAPDERALSTDVLLPGCYYTLSANLSSGQYHSLAGALLLLVQGNPMVLVSLRVQSLTPRLVT